MRGAYEEQAARQESQESAGAACMPRIERAARFAGVSPGVISQVGRREQVAGPLRPFDEADRVRVEVLPEAGAQPFRPVFESIEIKMIQV